jgi:hypothetical protein
MLGVKDYAARHNAGERTVRTWLADGRLHGARKLNGVWMIPADERPADPLQAYAGDEIAVQLLGEHAVQHVPHVPAGLVAELAEAPVFLPLELAAHLLGISEHAIRRHRDYFELVPFGPNGSLVMPARVVRTVAGL